MTRRFNLVVLFCFILISVQAQIKDLNYHYAEAKAAFENEDYSGFLTHTRKADSIRPFHPTLVKHLLLGHVVLKNEEEAKKSLALLLKMDASIDLAEDSLLAAFWERQQDLVLKIKKEQLLVRMTAEKSFAIADPYFHPEGIAYDQNRNRFYISSVRASKILAYENGTLVDSITQEQVPLASVMGMAIDGNTGALWVCSTLMPGIDMVCPVDSSMNQVYELDPNAKKILHAYPLPKGAMVGDLTISKNGKVYVSDSRLNQVYVLQNGVLLDTIKIPGYSVQGVTLDEKNKVLFVADYIVGLFRVNLKNHAVIKVINQTDPITKGIDGIYWTGNRLLVIQNGTFPKRLNILKLNADQNRITETAVIEQHRTDWIEPTLGVLVDAKFYFVADSQWPLYQKGRLTIEQPKNLKIMLLDLSAFKVGR